MALTHYEVLGVDQDATRSEITSAFRAQMRALHADAGGDDELAKHVSSAYNVLSNATKRATYDRTLSPQQSTSPQPAAAPSSPRRSDGAARDRVFTSAQGSPAFSMMSADPAAWSWHTPADDEDSSDSRSGTKSRSAVRIVVTILAFIAWAGAGTAATFTLGLPLARIDALSVPAALAVGVSVHLIWSILMITRAAMHRWGLVLSLLLALAAAGVIYLDAGTPLPTIGAILCLAATMATTYLSFGMALARAGSREGNGIIDSSFITHVGATTLGDRHPDVDHLLGVLQVAFGHRKGVRVILLPDRVTPRPNTSLVRSQVAVVVGRSVHLIAIPPLGADGLEISGTEIISDGQVHRNVVHDEAQALRRRFGRGADVHGYVVPTLLATVPTEIDQAGGVSFGSLTQVIDAVGTDAGPSLDKANSLFRHQALESMSLLV